MSFEHYIEKGGKMLRYGYTTGSCAALGAKAACEMLLSGKKVNETAIMTPKGFEVNVEILNAEFDEKHAVCAVMKDGGDDPDITHQNLVYAEVSKNPVNGVHIDGGKGVGRVTRPGLDQPMGNAAINSTPRKMIEAEVLSVCEKYGYDGGINVIISVPNGEELAKKTFNPQIGIIGGISILGTSGIVEPQSTQALIDCIEVELKAYEAENIDYVILTPGNYGENFLGAFADLKDLPKVKISNFVGESLKFSVKHNFTHVLMVGHIGKFLKIAGGIMNTHSDYGDCRMELIAAHSALCGADREVIKKIMNSVTTDDCMGILDEIGLRDEVLKSMLGKIQANIQRKVGDNIKIGAVIFSNKYGFLGKTDTADEVLEYMLQKQRENNGK